MKTRLFQVTRSVLTSNRFGSWLRWPCAVTVAPIGMTPSFRPAAVVRDGGAIVFVDRGHAPEASRRALSAGLCEIEQRHAGRVVVTSGIVTHLV